MKVEIISSAIIFIMVLATFGAVGTNQVNNINNSGSGYVLGEVVIGFRPQIDVKNMNDYLGRNIKDKIDVLNVAVVEVGIGEELSFINSVKSYPEVRYAELNGIIHATFIPNDPRWDAQWGPQRIHCAEAWDISQGSSSVKIAIVDTGINYDHEDLGNYVTGGYDWVNDDSDPMDDNGHGSHCAGIAAAVMNNEKGIAGVAQVKIMAEKVLDAGGSGYDTDVANGITHAADNEANIISLSLGGGASSVMKDACDYAYNTKGVLVVAASGNDYADEVSYPAGYASVIAVGAIDQNDERCSFSNYGSDLELMAPGYRIISSVLGSDTYDYYTGTSMACPHVAGVAALAKSRNPSWTNVQIRAELNNTAEDLGPIGWDVEYGCGLVDARLSGETPDEKAKVFIRIYKVEGLDALDVGSDPEWYYKVSLDDQSKFEYDGYDQKVLFWWVFHWNEQNTWTPDKTYEFSATAADVDIEIELMEDDVAFNDIADLSERPSDDYLGGVEGRIFTINYNLNKEGFDAITGDRCEKDGPVFYYTRGDWDGSTKDEGILYGLKQDDAILWFNITDTYKPEKYTPVLSTSPSSLPFGSVQKGQTKQLGLKIENTGLTGDPFYQRKLTWNINTGSLPSWITVSKSQGTILNGGFTDIIVTADANNIGTGSHSGNIVVQSDYGSKTIPVSITVTKSKSQEYTQYPTYTKSYYSIPVLSLKAPILSNFLYYLLLKLI